jgi:YebC/PmpR family DNA-binding regulatory protein
MSGHSKWANIKNRKGAQDKKRSEAFTRSAKDILTAIRMGGGNTNLEANSFLKTAVAKSREVNMPKENIERLIKKFEDRKANLVNLMLEGFGPMSVPMMIEVETDNKNRTLGEIKLIFRDNGGSLGEMNSVSFLFDKIGEIELEKLDADKELDLIDAGVEEIEENRLITKPELVNIVSKKATELGMMVIKSGVIMRAMSPVMLKNEEEVGLMMDLIDQLEENDDVVNVFPGFDYHG